MMSLARGPWTICLFASSMQIFCPLHLLSAVTLFCLSYRVTVHKKWDVFETQCTNVNNESLHCNNKQNRHFISFICPECTKTNNSEQIVGQDSKATQDALITVRINYKPNENNRNTIRTQQKKPNTREHIKIHLIYLPNTTIPMIHEYRIKWILADNKWHSWEQLAQVASFKASSWSVVQQTSQCRL